MLLGVAGTATTRCVATAFESRIWASQPCCRLCLAGILALPTTQGGDLAAAFAALWRQAALPPLMQAGVMEASAVLRHYVLVHDAASQGPEVAAAAQEQMHNLAGTMGAVNCQLLTINRGAQDGSNARPQPPWASMLHGCLPGGGAGEPAQRVPVPAGGLGASLSDGDVSGLELFVRELATRCILPHVEARLRALNAQVCKCGDCLLRRRDAADRRLRRFQGCPGLTFTPVLAALPRSLPTVRDSRTS